ncbi:tryptophan synthase subunit alpha [Brenneria tiliae]|uniref:tryptophan synthase subunit alpha n=1 Tax=Brenneria tiliae TaxID=2914984 RepID=UPI002014FAB0|nr:tryptophan synthase subunit alpha [Brenneria tiliae]MCL2897127.1 tryptophan synthase subunit alpha [Brenneria tiliae]MCL2904780.1 tryptophan synthase subunit alpha [Brenneria tiliae]
MNTMFINEIDRKFAETKKNGRAAIMPFLTMGYPEKELSLSLLETLSANGADIIEVGIPYSDPLADGPVIQHSSQLALDNGITPDQVFDILSAYNEKKNSAILVIMTYYNILLQNGLENFAIQCKKANVSGVVVPDLPLEECAQLKKILNNNKIHFIHFIPPNISEERIKLIASQATGFIYLISVTGVTGKRKQMDPNLEIIAKSIRKYTRTPIALGFGISNAKQVAQASKNVDGVIIGSALIEEIKQPSCAIERASKFMRAVSDYSAT